MKKLTVFLLSFFANQAFAQQILFQEKFESYSGYQIYGGWSQNAFGYPWETGWTDAIGNACFAPNNNQTKIAGVVDSWACGNCYVCSYSHTDSLIRLISPFISMSNVNNAWLQYDSYFKGTTINGKTEVAAIDVTSDSAISWTCIQNTTPNASGFQTQYVSLSPFNNLNNIKLGFRYQDMGETMSGWMIDNIKVFVPAPNDIALLSVTPLDSFKSYFVVGNAVLHEAKVMNYSNDTIHSFTLNFQKSNGPVHSFLVSGIQLLPFNAMNIVHPYLDTISSFNKEQVTFWVSLSTDNNHHNDTAFTFVKGVGFMPQKLLVIEEGTGTWNKWAPHGWVAMNTIFSNEQNVCQISAHAQDTMAIEDYADYLYWKGNYFVPFMLFDRRKNIPPDSALNELSYEEKYFGFADISLSSQITGNQLKVKATIIPATQLKGDYRLALMITEDSVRGNDHAFDQQNIYTGGAYGPMSGFENKPSPVPFSDMFYNFVARKVVPSPNGAFGSLPAYMNFPNSYNYTFNTTLSPSWKIERLKAFVFLINSSDSTILNSKRIPLALPVDMLNSTENKMGVFPNPSNDWTTVFFNFQNDQNITWTLSDISGKIIATSKQKLYAGYQEISLPVAALQTGIYFFTASSDSFVRTLKLQVMH